MLFNNTRMFLPPQSEEEYLYLPPNNNSQAEDFWSSISVVESLFKDEKISPFGNTHFMTGPHPGQGHNDWSDDDDDIIAYSTSDPQHQNLYLSGLDNFARSNHSLTAVSYKGPEGLILFQSLAAGTLLQVLSYLGAKELAQLERVCKVFKIHVNENSLWKELYMSRWKLLERSQIGVGVGSSNGAAHSHDLRSNQKSLRDSNQFNQNNNHNNNHNNNNMNDNDAEDSGQDEWAWIFSLLQQNERWKDIYKVRSAAEQWKIGTLKMFNGCWGFISQAPEDFESSNIHPSSSSSTSNSNSNSSNSSSSSTDATFTTLDIFFHRKDICPEGAYFEDWWLQDTPGVSRSQKCGYWDTFLYGRKVRYKQRAAYAQGRRPQACQISFLEQQPQTVAQENVNLVKQREYYSDINNAVHLNNGMNMGGDVQYGGGMGVKHNNNNTGGRANYGGGGNGGYGVSNNNNTGYSSFARRK